MKKKKKEKVFFLNTEKKTPPFFCKSLKKSFTKMSQSENIDILSNSNDILSMIQVLYDRTPNSVLSLEESKKYLQDAKQCIQKWKAYVYYPDVKDQKFVPSIGNVTFDSVSQKFSKELSPSQKQLVKNVRAEAIAVVQGQGDGPSCLNDNFSSKIIYLAGTSTSSVTKLLFSISKFLNLPMIAHVPRAWSFYFHNMGFVTRSDMSPKYDFLQNWILFQTDDLKNAENVLRSDTKPNVTIGINRLDNQSQETKTNINDAILNIDQTPYTSKPEEKPTDQNLLEMKRRFSEDYETLYKYAKTEMGKQINVNDVNDIRTVLVRMFEYCLTYTPNNNDNWLKVISLENMYEEFGVIAEPSGQVWYRHILARNDKREFAEKLSMMRFFAEHSPKYVSSQIRVEQILRSSIWNAKQKENSLHWVIKHLSHARDFETFAITNQQHLRLMHSRMQVLRTKWREEAIELSRQERMFANNVDPNEKQEKVDITPLRSAARKQIELKNTIYDTEYAWRNAIDVFRVAQPSVAKNLNVSAWETESKASAKQLTSEIYMPLPPTEPQDVAAAIDNDSIVTNLKTKNVFTQAVQDAKHVIENATEQRPDANNIVAAGQPNDPSDTDKILEQLRQNLGELKAVEIGQKNEILAGTKEFLNKALGNYKAIETLVNELGDNTTSEMKDVLSLAKQCHGTAMALAVNITKLEQDKDIEKATVGELKTLRDGMEASNNCIMRHYQSLQYAKQALEENNIRVNMDKIKMMLSGMSKQIMQAELANAEAEETKKKLSSALFTSSKTTNMFDEKIAEMRSITNAMRSDFETLKSQVEEKKLVAMDDVTQKQNDMKNNLEKVVRHLLLMQAMLEQQSDEFRILQAVGENRNDMEMAAKEAQRHAKLASEFLERQKQSEKVQKALYEKAALVKNPQRHLEISYDNLAQQERFRNDNTRLSMLMLKTELESFFQEPPSQQVLQKINDCLERISTFEKTNRNLILLLGTHDASVQEFEHTKRLGRDKVAEINRALAEEKTFLEERHDQNAKIVSMSTIVATLDLLQKAVGTSDKNMIRILLKKLKHEASESQYEMEDDARKLIKRALKILQS